MEPLQPRFCFPSLSKHQRQFQPFSISILLLLVSFKLSPLFYILTFLPNLPSSLCHPQISNNQRVDWKIHEEPVHYDRFSPPDRCGPRALKSVMRHGHRSVGELGAKHGMITASRFADVLYDWDISLYEGAETNVIGKSFVIRQGANEADYKCATIQSTSLNSFRPGVVPCEMMHYTDCLVGTAKDEVCVYRPCVGYRQYWGTVDDTTTLCSQHEEVFPKANEEPAVKEGVVSCKHGKHTSLKPVDARDMRS